MMSTPFSIFFLYFRWKISCMQLRSHMQTIFHALCMHLRSHMHVSCMHLRNQKGGCAHHIQLWHFLSRICINKLHILIPLRKISNFKKKLFKTKFGKWSYDHFKINKILVFFRKRPHGFQSFIQILFGYSSLQEEKVDMCGYQ